MGLLEELKSGPILWLYPREMCISTSCRKEQVLRQQRIGHEIGLWEKLTILQEGIAWRLYLMHAFFCDPSVVVVYFLYPETKAVTLEEMVFLSQGLDNVRTNFSTTLRLCQRLMILKYGR